MSTYNVGTDVARARERELAEDYAAANTGVKGEGWVGFAAIMLGLAAMFTFFDGLLAVTRSQFFVGNARYVFSDLRTWGWIMMIVGITALFAAFALYSGSQFARWFGIVAAGVNALAQLSFAQASPWWSLSIFALDVLVIYGLAVYAGPQLLRRTD